MSESTVNFYAKKAAEIYRKTGRLPMIAGNFKEVCEILTKTCELVDE